MVYYWVWTGIVIILVAIILPLSVYIVKQWEKAAILRFGKIVNIVEPGLNFKVPFIDAVREST